MKHDWLLLAGAAILLTRIKFKTDYDDLIQTISRDYGNDPYLVKALIRVESNFKPRSHNKKGEDSRGLGQINAPTAKALGVLDLNALFKPEYNILIMNKLICDLKTRFSSVMDIISAYNAGRVRLDPNNMDTYYNSEYTLKVYSYYLAYKILHA